MHLAGRASIVFICRCSLSLPFGPDNCLCFFLLWKNLCLAEETCQHPCNVQFLMVKGLAKGLSFLSLAARRLLLGTSMVLFHCTMTRWVWWKDLVPGWTTSTAVRLWKRHLAALNLDFPTCKMGILGDHTRKGEWRGPARNTVQMSHGRSSFIFSEVRTVGCHHCLRKWKGFNFRYTPQ